MGTKALVEREVELMVLVVEVQQKAQLVQLMVELKLEAAKVEERVDLELEPLELARFPLAARRSEARVVAAL